jgi:hypothetical protein
MKLMKILYESVVGMDKIIHLDEMSTDDFIKFVKGFVDIANRNVEVSEKIDGQNFSFGLDLDDTFFSKTKKSKPITDASAYGEFSFLQGLKEYHSVLNSNVRILKSIKNEIRKLNKSDEKFGIQIFGEILPSSQTNIVKYDADKIGNGAIVLFDIKINGITILQKPYSKVIFSMIVKGLDNKGGWRVYEKPTVDQNTFKFEVNHLLTLETLYRNYFDILKSRKRADKETKDKAKRVIQSLMDNIKGQFLKNMMQNRKSVLGNVTPEGFILRDFSNNLLVKLVDKDSFSKENTEGSRFVKEAQSLVRVLNTNLKNDIFGNADIMKNFAKVIEKAVDWAFVQKQINPNFKVKSLDDVLKVAYDDMVDEKRIKYTSAQAISKSVELLQLLRVGLEKSATGLETEKESLPDSKYIISKEKIDSYIKSTDDTIVQLNSLKGKDGIKVYLTLMAFVFGPAKMGDLKSEFNLNESLSSKILLVL